MKKTTYTFCAIALFLFSSFSPNLECEYANSNIGFAKSQIKEALVTDDINQARFFSYKALGALEKSKRQLQNCGCTYANSSMKESLDALILATKSTTLEGTKNYLNESMELTESTIRVLSAHDTHESNYSNDVLAMNTNSSAKRIAIPIKDNLSLNEKIDISLEKYKNSLNKVVETVNCRDATAFAKRIYEECELQLLKPNLSEGKKYYNLRTKEITAKALERIGACADENSK